jgi:DNA/RNA-binding domain of Phe-tRNA-synthetase-like protein
MKARLRALADRFDGAQAIVLRSKPIPHAYRVFYRHVGLDPDVDRIPVEALVVDRLKTGGFRSRTLIEDAATIAVMETSVPVWALDADTVQGPFGIRPAQAGEALGRGEGAPPLPVGRLCVVDAAGPVAILFGDVAAAHRVGRGTRRAVVFSVQVAGVPAIGVSEALWTVADIVGEGP